MNKRYYFSIRYTPSYADFGLLAGRCIQQMHMFVVNNPQAKNHVGVCFPRWNATDVGDMIAFVMEDKETLLGLSFQPYFSMMIQEGVFEVSRVCEVPECSSEVRFVRNQTIGKSFIASKQRRMKRSMARAELLDVEHIPVAVEERVVDHFHRIPISSGSSGQEFILHIQKEFTESREQPRFNSYGFATNQEKKGTVPGLHI
ncbi:type I-F CRISPR-associated endoribonuclease Cas6/Csy4 [Vibrio sp. CAU 1672]|uniref:type I-F CRISPR-associated endoribonuclease Cas6/Csy4 n=1 Tax=Vibrio sp. CAU 1672 TaxID=3032594 RepID=UPI0023DB895E|nr:type I-F CRISPR-associated endoribonuclease Cas6/Csy4 [Vibrio sp. CAU 1672]MDF2152875.1 type I-F CRISPR-associated endoribonuclease Cas6/Csy4 [Vibrio sp. CAU 1672]